jgi:hypothetical protein
MKYASAMKYGGELVDAVDCDYDSFKEMVPLCPNCKEPVYLRSGGQRESVKGKAYQIGPHWCHFKGISAEQVSGCELRVNDYTEKDRAKIAAQARGQRLKLLQRWFWDVFSNSTQGQNSSMQSKIQRRDNWMSDSRMSGLVRLTTESLTPGFMLLIKSEEALSEVIEIYSNRVENVDAPDFKLIASNKESSIEGEVSDYVERVRSVCSIAGISLHSSQVKEVLRFLSAKTSFPILNEVMEIYVCSRIEIAIVSNNETLLDLLKKIWDGHAEKTTPEQDWLLISGLLDWVWMIPWASEFQRLEAEAQQRKDAA